MSLVEKCWMVTSKISVIAYLVITGICFGRFVCPYMKKKKTAVMGCVVYTAVILMLYSIPPRIDNFCAYLIGVVAAFFVMYAGDRRNLQQKLFLAVTFFSIRWLSVAMAERPDDFMMKAFVFRNVGRAWLQYGIYAATRVLYLGLCFGFMALATGLINKAYVYKKDEMSGKEMVMLIMPSLVSVTGYGIVRYYMTIYEKDTGESLMDHYGLFGALTFFHYLVSMIAILVMIVMFQNWKATQEEQRAQELMRSQIRDMQKHIGEVEKLYQDIRSMRHDMGNHIQTLEHLVELHKTEDATEYLDHLKTEWHEVSPEIKTGSPVIDVILMEKAREAKEKQIRFTVDFHYPEHTKLNAFDLSVIMNNALSNCMENVSGDDSYICVSSFQKNSIFLITVRNSFQGQLHFGDDDLPETTKTGKEHGIGLHNIRRVAQMYMGEVSLEQGDGAVTLSIMLQVK